MEVVFCLLEEKQNFGAQPSKPTNLTGGFTAFEKTEKGKTTYFETEMKKKFILIS